MGAARQSISGSGLTPLAGDEPPPPFKPPAVVDTRMADYQRLLVATDGSDTADLGVEQALELAALLDLEVRAVSVVDAPPPTGPDSESGERARARRTLTAVRTAGEDRDVTVDTGLLVGDPRREILEDANERDADVVVMGTHGRTGVRRWVMGSVAAAVVREAVCPVLTVNRRVPAAVTRFDDVLVATDGRPGADGAIDHALEIADAVGATVHALSVVDDVHSRIDVVLEAVEQAGRESMDAIAERAAERGLDADQTLERGIVHERIVEYADEHDVDLVVLGTESRPPLERFVVGSVSQRVIGRSPVPVLTVRTPHPDASSPAVGHGS